MLADFVAEWTELEQPHNAHDDMIDLWAANAQRLGGWDNPHLSDRRMLAICFVD